MDSRTATTLRMAFWGIALFVAFVYGSKHYKKFARKEALVLEMRTAISDASFYRSLTPKDAHATFLKAIAVIDEANSNGMVPAAFFAKVFEHDAEKAPLGQEYEDYPARERIARETLLRGYQHALQFSLLDKPEKRALLAKGELPEGTPKPMIANIIDPAVSPGMERIVPNLELRAAKSAGAPPTDLEVAAAKELASELSSANVIEYEAQQRIVAHYLKNAAGKKAQEEP
jgi:hypothetical protein